MKSLFGLLILSLILTAFKASLKEPAELTPYPFPELKYFPKMPVNADNPVTVEGAELGRYLFYDSILSRDYTVSCASCHKQHLAFSDNRHFSTGINGKKTTRNTQPLFNLAWYPSFFWDGRAASLEEQVFFPVRDHAEMNLDWKTAAKRINKSAFYRKQFQHVFGIKSVDSVHIAKAIAQFERTLLSYNSKYDKALRREVMLDSAEYAGFVIMNDQSMGNCLHCHSTDSNPLATNLDFANNGLQTILGTNRYADNGLFDHTGKEKDLGRFKVPSLRNIALTAPYMHDGRFTTLEEVVSFYGNGIHDTQYVDHRIRRNALRFTDAEKKCIVAFLCTLTDSTFITNPAFSKPKRN